MASSFGDATVIFSHLNLAIDEFYPCRNSQIRKFPGDNFPHTLFLTCPGVTDSRKYIYFPYSYVHSRNEPYLANTQESANSGVKREIRHSLNRLHRILHTPTVLCHLRQKCTGFFYCLSICDRHFWDGSGQIGSHCSAYVHRWDNNTHKYNRHTRQAHHNHH